MNETFFWTVLTNLAMQAPSILIFVTGIFVSINFLSKYPTPASWSLLAFSILMVTSIVAPVIQMMLVYWRTGQSGSLPNYAILSGIIAFVTSCFRAFGYGLLLVAVFSGRATHHVSS